LRLSRAHAHTQQHPRRYYAHEDRDAHTFFLPYGDVDVVSDRQFFIDGYRDLNRDSNLYRHADEYLHGHDHQHTY
jgi:hypothetical protein